MLRSHQLASCDDVEAMAQRLPCDPATYHAATLATVVFGAPHAEEGYPAISLGVIPTCEMFQADHCCVVRQHMEELCSNTAFADRYGDMLFAHTDGDDGGPATWPHFMMRVLAPTLGRLRFWTFRAKRICLECVELSHTHTHTHTHTRHQGHWKQSTSLNIGPNK